MTNTPGDDDAVARLRGELLTSGLSDWMSLAEVQQIISHLQLADDDDERQRLVIAAIRELLDRGLMEIGELPAQGEPFPAWKPPNVAMHRLVKRFIGRYSDPTSWDYSIWLNLTDEGRRVAEQLGTA
jgi:hypothetical protein